MGGRGSAIDRMYTNEKKYCVSESVSEFNPPPPPPLLSTDVGLSKYFAFRTFTRDAIRPSVNGGEMSSKRTMLDKMGKRGQKSIFLVGRP